MLAGQLYFLIANRQLNQIVLSVDFQIYEVSDCIFHVLYINFNTFQRKIASFLDLRILLRGKHYN